MRHPIPSSSVLILASAFLLAGNCKGNDTGPDTTPDDTQGEDTWADFVDADGDGVTETDGDCDDEDPNVFPGNEEECNGADDNCNDVIDEGYGDADNDGIADCVDTEECDGIDNDGDGSVDEGFADSDGNGTADCVEEEICDGLDNDGDGLIDEDQDEDGDGYTWCGSDDTAADCDDTNAEISPGETEVEDDGVDNDCDGLVDEGQWAEGDIVIVEVMSNPEAVSDAYGEWVEIYNASERDLYLNGLLLTSSVDSDYHIIESDELLVMEPGQLMILGVDEDSAVNGDVSVDYQYDDVILSNETDDLLIMAGEILLDQVAWDDGAAMPDESGASMSLDPWIYLDEAGEFVGHIDNDTAENWCDSITAWGLRTDDGSPGSENEYCHSWDHDGDGYNTDDGDCDDGDATVYPGAPETDPTVDNDCDGEIEWAPTAIGDYDAVSSSLLTCSPLYLVGSGSFDPEGDALTYSWELSSVPSGSARSTSDIEDATDADPVFYPDVAGDYEFSLVVDDGGVSSTASTVSVTISDRGSNSVPVASAGSDQSYSYTQTCTLSGYSYVCSDCADYDFAMDATGTTDADDSDLIYAWTITSGSSYGSLDDSSSQTPTLTMTNLTCSYGSTATYTVELSLAVTDCPGDAGSDTVTVTYSCTGS
jgi:hypothetical protein